MSASLRIAVDLFRRLPGHRSTLGLAAGAVALATTVLLLVASVLAGIQVRAEREAWLEPRAGAPIAAQVTSTQFLDHRPVTIVRLAPAGTASAGQLPAPPGLDRFPRPGELALSPALAEALRGRGDALGLGADPAAATLIGPEALGGPDDLLAVIGHRPGDSPMTAPPVRDITGLTRFAGPVEIDSFVGTAERDVVGHYRSAALLAGALLVVPATGLVAAAAGLGARSRAGRIARLRLAGTPRGVLTRLRVFEALAIGAAGVAAGVVLLRLLLPAVARIPLAGTRFAVTDLIVPLPSTVLVATGVAGVLLLRLLTLSSRAVQEPLATADALPTSLPVLWRLGLTGIAILGLAVANQQSDPSLILLLAVLLLVFGTVSVLGPIAVAAIGRLLLVGQSAASLIAGRRLAEDPRAAWRPISGVALAGFIAGLLAFGEGRAHASLDDEVRSFVEERFPGQTVLSTNVRGRPYLLSQWNQEMQLAYVELAPPPGAVRHLLLVRNLRDGRSGVLSSFLWLPYAEHPTEPVLASDGSFTDIAVVAGRPVRFAAHVEAGRVTVTADGGSPPAPVQLEMLDGFSLDVVRATDQGVGVGLDMAP